MEDFMLNRRYCRFKSRKVKKTYSMNDQGEADALSFKVRRFIRDVEKYSERHKKKKARKEAKLKDNMSSLANKGVFKSAILSHHGLKALLSSSTVARQNGDLMALSEKKFTRELIAQKIRHASNGGNQTKQRDVEVENISPQKSNKSLADLDLGELSTIPVETHNDSVEIFASEPNTGGQDNQIQRDYHENSLHYAENCSTKNISAPDPILDESPEERSPEIIARPPSVENGEFFDLLDKTPEKSQNPNNDIFISPPKENNMSYNDAITFQNRPEISTFIIDFPEPVNKPVQRPEDYIFKLSSTPKQSVDKSYLNDADQYENIWIEFEQKATRKRCDKHTVQKPDDSGGNLLTSPNFFKTKPSTLAALCSDFSIDFVKTPPRRELSFSRPIHKVPIQKITEKDFYIAKNLYRFKKENLQHVPSKKLKEQNIFKNRKHPMERNDFLGERTPSISNSRFRNNLKFSPHKYC